MNPATVDVPAPTPAHAAETASWRIGASCWKDYFALAKPRITLMILLTVGVAMVFAAQLLSLSVPPVVWLSALIGTSLVAASASVLNQWYERDRDSLMPRTQKRPLPDGRLTTLEASLFGWVLVVAGLGILWFGTTAAATGVSFVTWLIYCWIYTPMKVRSYWNTAVGTLPGALPVMIGWTAVGGELWSWAGWALTGIVILWQFPHFMSIAWLYRHQYTQAGFRMLTREDPSGMVAAWHALLPALALIPLSMAVLYPVGIPSWIVAILGGLAAWTQVSASYRFLKSRDDATARKLLRASLVYLPAIMLLVVLRWVCL
ncbi:MAG: heme o synthase [Pirellula sp.]